MKELIKLLLNSFECYEIIYKGEIYSNNDAQSKHWRQKAKLVKNYKEVLGVLIKQAKLPWFEQFGLVVYYNSRHDCDNVGSMNKIFIDSFKQKKTKGRIIQKGYCEDDSKKYYRLSAIVPDESLAPNTFKFVLIKIK